MDTVQIQFAAPPAAANALQSRAEAAASMADISGVVARGTDAPLPFPAGLGQTGEVNKSRMLEAVTSDMAPERVLKPWGLPMLPDLAKQEAEAEEAETEDDATEQSDGDTAVKASGTADNDVAAATTFEGPDRTVASGTPADPATPPTDPFVKDDDAT